jgi:hypothetical protein
MPMSPLQMKELNTDLCAFYTISPSIHRKPNRKLRRSDVSNRFIHYTSLIYKYYNYI